MSLLQVFGISGTGMTASSVRLSTTASNLANAETAAESAEKAYKAKMPVFKAMYDRSIYGSNGSGVEVSEVVESAKNIKTVYQPENPLANEEGMVFYPGINPVEEMANMISASRSYSNQVEVFRTAKQLVTQTLNMGK